MASWVASSNVSLTSVWPYSPALILSRAVQNQPGKPWLPITWVGIGGSVPVTRRSYQRAWRLAMAGASEATRYDKNTHHARAFLGHSWLDRRARAGDCPLRRQHVLRRGTSLRRHGDHPRLRHRRARARAASCPDAATAHAPAPLHRPHPLGPHPGLPVLRPRVPAGLGAEHLRAVRLPAWSRGGDGGSDGVLVLPGEDAGPALADPLHRARRGLLPRGPGAGRDAVHEPYRADRRVPHDRRRRHPRVRD